MKILSRSSKATSPLGTIDEFTYAPRGVQTKAVKKSASAAAFMESSTLYTLNYNYPVTGKDARNKATETAYDDSLGILLYVDDPMGSRVNYLYDQIRRATKVYTESDGKTYMNEYTYTGDYLTGVKHNTGSNTVSDVIYYFSYDPLGNPTTVKVGTQTLSTNVYTSSGDKLLQRVDYGNGGKVHYTRDAFKRVTGVRFDSETADRYQYDFDAAGQVARVKDNALNRINLYEYDAANRPARTTQLDSSNWNLHTAVLSYDAYNNISRFEEQLGYWRTKYPTDFLYDDENRPTSLRYNGTVNRTDYVYDALGRISSRNAVLNNAFYLSSYSYAAGGYGANSTSPLVSGITQSGHNLSYAYDDNGNITSVVYKGQTIGYVYDALGQLIRVNDQVNNESWTYDYDRGGNILGKKRYGYTTGTLGSPNHTEEYQYGDTNWKDKLTARVINGVSYPVVSDAIGNITAYAGWTYTWQAGRQLASQTNSGGTVEYKYNADGLRVQKKRGSTVTDYILSGKNITHMTVTGGHTLHFYYDGQNRPAQVQYNGTMYRYVHNLQGDILAILDSAGNTVVQYAYDAWGGKKTTTGSMAGTLGYLNPFRYRGYVWDEETWMYYLRSRYYYPELQRFISADPVIGVQGCIVLCNLFHYCKNNPIIFVDPSGKLFGAVAILVTAVAGLASILYADNKIANTPGLTKQEIALSRTYMLQAYLAKNAAESASRLTDFYFGKGATNADTTRANAFKHAVWNAIMARDLGIDFAEAFASAHESNDINDVRSYNPQGTPTTIREASVMDLINNQRGRELTLISSWWVASDETIAKGVINDLNVNAHLYSIITWGVFELPIQ